MRAIFDDISLSVVTFLEAHQGVTDVRFAESPPATSVEIDRWHRSHHPVRLPPDLENFYLMQNGLSLKWRMRFNGEILPLGNMHVNSANTIEKIDLSQAVFADGATNSHHNVGFALDSTADGRVVLVFSKDLAATRVYFQDLSSAYNFVCDTFTEYMRLMVMHLGIARWQYAFTKCGLPPSSIQWFRLMSPERLHLDLRHSLNPSLKIQDEAPASAPVPKGSSQQQPRTSDIDFEKIEKTAKVSRSRNKKKHKKSTPDLLTGVSQAESMTSSAQRLARPGSAPGRRPPGPGTQQSPKMAGTARLEHDRRQEPRGSF
ncbi:Knr4/Smi1-like domain-containing protein [Plasmodiophora brassicae]|uniref:Knr4/Smi1-like domain-containing protein n=1 Tax=Plasmodiophora brassicae TaxID=37360 RepID=A0A0G4J2W1_PLABS|nr:hypothetical protein PBRA_008848 [Plasmodiophora brassicae]SPQ98679.1 unnamed protein product [Plasmodiophora brassicae]